MAGSLYLVVAVLGGFAELYVRDRFVDLGDPGATAANIRDSATLFRAGFAADLVQATFFLFTAMALFLLLRHVNELVARGIETFVLAPAAIGEIAFVVWLLVKGVPVRERDELVPALAA
jgi:hypothetical protein